MKILISHYAIIDKEGFGRSFMLARELSALGNNVTFLTSLPAKRFSFPYYKEVREGVKIIAFPDIVPDFMRRTGFGFLSVIFKFIFILFRRFDIYHSDAGHRPNGGLPILIKKAFKKIAYVAEWWDFFGKGGQYDGKKGIKKITHGYYDLIFEVTEKRLASGVICLSHGMLERAIKLKLQNRLTVITGGSDTRSLAYYPTTSFKSKYKIPPDSLTFGFVGMNIGEFLDVLPFIQALKILRGAGLNINWFTTGRYLDKTLKEKYGIENELVEFGWVNYKDFPEILSCADVFLLLQRENMKSHTRWPNKIGDYFAAGRPILTNPYGEIKRLAKANSYLFFSVEFNTKTIVEKITDIYNEVFNNTKITIEKRNKIRQFAETEFSWNLKAKQLLCFYNEIINHE